MSTKTTLQFAYLAGHETPATELRDGALDDYDVRQAVKGVIAQVRPDVVITVGVDLTEGARDGVFYVYVGTRVVGEGSVTIADVDDTPPPPVVTYPDGQPAIAGDVVQVGNTGTAIHVVAQVSPDGIWLRESGGRRRQSVVPVGRLRLLERQAG